jgi:AMOP domain
MSFNPVSWGHHEAEKFPSPDPKIWAEPANGSLTIYHPGAYNRIRTKAANATGSGLQCCYDKQGRLITQRPGAGTPDHTQAGGAGHILDDVVAFGVASFLDNYRTSFPNYVEKYIEARPPNNPNNCPRNP